MLNLYATTPAYLEHWFWLAGRNISLGITKVPNFWHGGSWKGRRSGRERHATIHRVLSGARLLGENITRFRCGRRAAKEARWRAQRRKLRNRWRQRRDAPPLWRRLAPCVCIGAALCRCTARDATFRGWHTRRLSSKHKDGVNLQRRLEPKWLRYMRRQILARCFNGLYIRGLG